MNVHGKPDRSKNNNTVEILKSLSKETYKISSLVGFKYTAVDFLNEEKWDLRGLYYLDLDDYCSFETQESFDSFLEKLKQ